MARFLSTRSNPAVFGEDVESMAWQALGIGTAAVANDKTILPFLKRLTPDSFEQGLSGKMLDAASTALTGFVVGEVVGFISRPVGRQMKKGGVLLGVAKALVAFIPGTSMTGSIPTSWPAFMLPGGLFSGGGTAAALAAPKAPAPALVTDQTRLGIGSMGL